MSSRHSHRSSTPGWHAVQLLALLAACMGLAPQNTLAEDPRKAPAAEAPRKAPAAEAPERVVADTGTLVSWAAPGTQRCGMDGKNWAALDGVCYFPIDLLHKTGRVSIARWTDTGRELAYIEVVEAPYETLEIELKDDTYVNVSPENIQRMWRENLLLSHVFRQQEPARFTLPLGLPASKLPEGKDFGAERVFNGMPSTQRHTGRDYAVGEGTPVLAVADGTVAVARDLFLPGRSVFVQHGDGLVSEYFHLSEIEVQEGQEVRRGDVLGKVGSTGRATGPHLHFGVRWHNARIDPDFLLGDPAQIPAIP
jgi:peptidase M23-like protein